MTRSFEYLKTSKIMQASVYPYTATLGSCKYNPSQGIASTTSYVNLPKWSPSALMTAVAQQPTTVAVNSNSAEIFFYRGGIIVPSRCTSSVNHAVLAVGYGHDNATGLDYWIIKNSKGPTWGEGGYFRIKRTTGNDAGPCGLYSSLSAYPII